MTDFDPDKDRACDPYTREDIERRTVEKVAAWLERDAAVNERIGMVLRGTHQRAMAKELRENPGIINV